MGKGLATPSEEFTGISLKVIRGTKPALKQNQPSQVLNPRWKSDSEPRNMMDYVSQRPGRGPPSLSSIIKKEKRRENWYYPMDWVWQASADRKNWQWAQEEEGEESVVGMLFPSLAAHAFRVYCWISKTYGKVLKSQPP